MTQSAPKFPLFEIGAVVATPGAMRLIGAEDISIALWRHMSGDWGDVDDEDRALNNQAVLDGTRLLSVYRASDKKFYIITESDRSVTTFLLPEEY